MKELSVFVDESGDKSLHARYFLVTVVIHDQANKITEKINAYERSLDTADLPNVPFHSEPLLNGHEGYADLSLSQRKKLLYSFNVLVQRLPIQYATFVYKHKEHKDSEDLAQHIKRDLTALINEHLQLFQDFDKVKIYYDNGQKLVRQALYGAISSCLSQQAVIRKRTTMTEYRLAQVADYLCTIELAAVKYVAKENGGTYDKFFGGIGMFKKNWLKQARRKLLSK